MTRALTISLAAAGWAEIARATQIEPTQHLPSEQAERPSPPLKKNQTARLTKLDWLTSSMADRVMFFAGADLWRQGVTGFIGGQWAPGKLDSPGFFLRVIASTSLDAFTADNGALYTTGFDRGSVLAGYKFKRGKFELQLSGGPDAQLSSSRINGRNRILQRDYGARASADIWWEPTDTTMLQISLTTTTIDQASSGRIAGGFRIGSLFWMGPEILYSQDRYGAQHRYGAHLTGLKLGGFEWTVASGVLQDGFGRSGVYGRLGAVWRPTRKLSDVP